MANTYTYKINTLDYQTADGKVLCIHYSIIGDNGEGVTASINGTTGLGGEVHHSLRRTHRRNCYRLGEKLISPLNKVLKPPSRLKKKLLTKKV